MACFIVPMIEAVTVSLIDKGSKDPEASAPTEENTAQCKVDHSNLKACFTSRLSWLKNMLWGGTFLLAIEHIWHGEVVPWPPFLTAIQEPGAVGPMLEEMATVGVGMAILVTLAWVVMVLISRSLELRSPELAIVKEEEEK